MNSELNLIPASYRAQLRRIKLLLLSKNILVAAMLYLIVVAIVLLVSRAVLQQQFIRIVGETTLLTKENDDIESSVRTLNDSIVQGDRLESKSYPWSEFLLHLATLVSPGVRLSTLDLNQGGPSTIEGLADTRESLIQFRDQLNTDPAFGHVDLPVSTLLNRSNIDFTITFTLNVKNQ